MPKTQSNLPTDNENHTVEGVFAPGTGVVAAEGGPVFTDPQTGFQYSATAIFLLDALSGLGLRIPSKILPVNLTIVSGTPQSIWTPAAGKRFRLLGWSLSLSVAGQIIFKDQANTAFSTPELVAAAPYSPPFLGMGYLSSATNNHLQLDASVSGTVLGFVLGSEE